MAGEPALFFTIRAGCGYESLHDGLGLGQMEQDPSGAVEADSVIKVSTCYLAMLEVLKSRGVVDVWRGRGRRRGRSRCRRQRALRSQERRHLGTRRGPRFRVEGRVDGPIPRRRLDERAVVACVEINKCVGCTDNSSLSHFSAMTLPS